ncbi:MAG: ABC transporter substrate-binding protein [Propionicimonas sp.]|uniref:ABC transporter substrate-binding protein n=1 Tax=Propionicimonas sp. TaxID=1955623 RepID=UPI002B1FFDD6|nr:ABC transporter substrate-binding protein [Propionicimonas sp.]MEA4943059.1 ABC transporter substrate-binding protein [Propionicimonas sp.]MEA5118696.1 ABC transporter substrate-binding protein [Propionicimonas sp.]
MKIRSRAALTSAFALTLTMLASCAVDEAGVGTDTGKPSGKLVVACGAQEDWCQAMTAAFQAKTGVETSFVRLSSGEAVARLESAKEQPEFDVWHGGPADGYGQAREKNLLEAYVSPNAAAIPAQYKDPDGWWTGVYVGALGLCSNTEVLSELGVEQPMSWEDLLNSKLKGQIMMAHPATSGTAYTALWTQVVLKGGEDQGLEYMKKLNSNILQYSKTGSAPGEAAARGEVAVGIIFTHDCVKYREEGAKSLVVTHPSDGAGYEIGGVAMIAKNQNPTAAKAYIDWALTAEAQDIGPTVGSFQVLTAPDAVTDERMAKLSEIKLIDYDFAAAAAAKSGLIARFDAEIASEPKE